MINKELLVICDFDGVLIDSLTALYLINNHSALKIGKNISLEEYINLFNKNIHKSLFSFLSVNNILYAKFIEFKKTIFPQYYNTDKVKMFNFTNNMLENLSRIAKIFIVTSAPLDSTLKFVQYHNLSQYIQQVTSTQKEGKKTTYKNIIDLYKDHQCVLITDTVGDITEAKNLPIITIAVTWGFQNKKMLQKASPDLIAENWQMINPYLLSLK
jgi:phosphoglycolate phosphatase